MQHGGHGGRGMLTLSKSLYCPCISQAVGRAMQHGGSAVAPLHRVDGEAWTPVSAGGGGAMPVLGAGSPVMRRCDKS